MNSVHTERWARAHSELDVREAQRADLGISHTTPFFHLHHHRLEPKPRSCGPWATCGQLPVVLAHSHAHLFTYCPWLLSHDHSSFATGTLWPQSQKYLYLALLRKSLLTPALNQVFWFARAGLTKDRKLCVFK